MAGDADTASGAWKYHFGAIVSTDVGDTVLHPSEVANERPASRPNIGHEQSAFATSPRAAGMATAPTSAAASSARFSTWWRRRVDRRRSSPATPAPGPGHHRR